jgi:hypothetical protein
LLRSDIRLERRPATTPTPAIGGVPSVASISGHEMQARRHRQEVPDMNTHSHSHTYIHIDTYTCTYTHTYTITHAYICAQINVHKRRHTHTHIGAASTSGLGPLDVEPAA